MVILLAVLLLLFPPLKATLYVRGNPYPPLTQHLPWPVASFTSNWSDRTPKGKTPLQQEYELSLRGPVAPRLSVTPIWALPRMTAERGVRVGDATVPGFWTFEPDYGRLAVLLTAFLLLAFSVLPMLPRVPAQGSG